MNCSICSSCNITLINTYKHYWYSCSDCNNLFKAKEKNKYFIELIFPNLLARKIFPYKVFKRLFHDNDVRQNPEKAYDYYALESENISETRDNEATSLLHTFKENNINIEGKTILDISGGPGNVGKILNNKCNKCVVTEFSHESVKKMKKNMGIEAYVFDYNSMNLQDIFNEKFDIIMLRSSIVFCADLNMLIKSLNKIIQNKGIILLETLTPSLGTILWWQEMNYMFTRMYSQETIEKLFYKWGFNQINSNIEYVKPLPYFKEIRKGLFAKIYLYLVAFPLMIFYRIRCNKSKIAVDTSDNMKYLKQLWQSNI